MFMRKTLLVRAGESQTDCDLLLETVKSHIRDSFIKARNFRTYCLIENIPHQVKYDQLIEDITGLGFTVLLAIEENADGIDEVLYPENDEDVLKGYQVLDTVIGGLHPRN